MKVDYRLTVTARCPSDSGVDVYDITVTSDRMVLVEDILKIADQFGDRAIYQEELTEEMAAALDATVTSRGQHYGVDTTCEATPA
jgi:GTP cyclohydrolase I